MEEKPRSSVSPVTDSRAEQKLVEAAQQGDKRAFGELVRMHQKRLFRFIYGLSGSFDKTEDIVQEAFVKAYSNITTFKVGHDFYPWLSVIARNLAYNLITREKRQESLDQLTEAGFDTASADLGPLEQLLSTDSQSAFYKALKKLPDQYRSVFVLRHFEQMDYHQIASYLKIPPGTVDSRLYRARQLLMEALKEYL